MTLTEMYDKILNPIEDPEVIRRLITAYSNMSNGLGGFYGQLTKTVKKEHNRGQYFLRDADKFYSMMFNKWKNSIVAMTKEEFIELYRHGSYGQDFIKMRKFLKGVSDVSTMKEANDILFSDIEDMELRDALEKYRWNAFGGGSCWTHVCSRHLTAKKDKYPNIEHRLYIDTESFDTYKMILQFISKCDEHHMPYYFKFDQFANRDDTIVIYSSTEDLLKYIEILQEIKKEHLELVARTKEPPLLTGKIDNWIGYGSEPSKTPDGKNQSFNEVRAKAIEPAIEKTTKKWIMEHKKMLINYRGNRMIFQDYIAIVSTEVFIKNLERAFLRKEDYERNCAKQDGRPYSRADVVLKLGYSIEEINSSQSKDKIFRVLSAHMAEALTAVCMGNYTDMPPISININRDLCLTFKGYDLEKSIQMLSVSISKNDPLFISTVREEIKYNARQFGVDTGKFCYDMASVAKIKAHLKEEHRQEQTPMPKSKIETIEKPKQIEQPQNETRLKRESIDLKSLDVQTLPLLINPELLKRKMRLPNGIEIHAKQYIQEIVYPQIPKTGVVVLSSNSVLPVKQFIEEYVMFECQEKYNGDFPRYMAEKTKSNLGVISFKNGPEKSEITSIEITDYIDQNLLEQKITLPNGTEIPVRQYIQEYFSPHIPMDGRIILQTGAEISVKQYIEEVLLGEVQKKYHGDIAQILYNTTRNNAGIVNADPRDVEEILMQLRDQIETNKQQGMINDNPTIK